MELKYQLKTTEKKFEIRPTVFSQWIVVDPQ